MVLWAALPAPASAGPWRRGAGSGTQIFSAPAAITINDNAIATPYPASVNVSGMSGTISKVVVKINGLTHAFARDIDMLLVGPGGQKVMLMSDAGGNLAISNACDLRRSSRCCCTPNYGNSDGHLSANGLHLGTLLPIAFRGEAAPYPADLAVFNGTSPNGTWNLFVLDDGADDAGQLANGFTLTITTLPPTITTLSPMECLFNWAEITYPTLFTPAGAVSQLWSPFTYRYYSATNTYVGVSSSDAHVYYQDAQGNRQDVGPLSEWLSRAGCQ